MPSVFVHGREYEIVETDRFSDGYLSDSSRNLVYVPRGQRDTYEEHLRHIFQNDNHVENHLRDPENPLLQEVYDAYEHPRSSEEVVPRHVRLEDVLRIVFSRERER